MRRSYCVPEKSEHQGTHKGCPYGVWGKMRIHDPETMDEASGLRKVSLQVSIHQGS